MKAVSQYKIVKLRQKGRKKVVYCYFIFKVSLKVINQVVSI